MADVLSQSQIDALLKSMQGGTAQPEVKENVGKPEPIEKKYRKYDFYSPRKFTKEKMKILNSVFENYARILTSQVNGIFRVMTDITVMEVQEKRYYEYVNSFQENDCMTLVDTVMPEKGRQNVPMMLHITPGLVITLINHMLGGGDEVIRVEEDYRYSDVELALYRRGTENTWREVSRMRITKRRSWIISAVPRSLLQVSLERCGWSWKTFTICSPAM